MFSSFKSTPRPHPICVVYTVEVTLSVQYYVYQSTNIIHLWGLLGLTTTFLTIRSETFGFYLKSATYVTIFLVIMVIEVRTKCVRLCNPTHFLTEYNRRMWIHPLNKTLSLILSQNACSILKVTMSVCTKKQNNGVIRLYNMIRRHKVLMLTI